MFQSPSATAEKPQPSAPRRERPSLPCSAKRVYSPCPAASGKCGKCLILAATEPCAEERALLGDAALASGCASPVTPAPLRGSTSPFRRPGPCACSPGSRNRTTRSGPSWSAAPSPCPSRPSTTSAATCNASSTPAAQRGHALGLGQLAALPAFIRNARSNGGCGDGHGNVCGFGLMHGETLVGYTASDEAYALIVDIGTTTVAALLVDTARRRVVAARGEHNANRPTARTSSAASATKRNGKNTATARTRCNRPSPSRFPQCSPGCWNRPGSATWTSCP